MRSDLPGIRFVLDQLADFSCWLDRLPGHGRQCGRADLDASWAYFRRNDLRTFSAVDATSFAIMRRARIRLAFAFDHHFAVAGFRMVG